ncbi:MAG: type II toxin-antitoxin system CcdA family antitoxin [Bdellovibrionales bacterium]
MLETQERPKKKSINLTIREDIIADAKAFKINASREAETALAAAVKRAKEEQWLKDNAAAIEAHNERVRKRGVLVKPYWARDDNW